MIRVSFRYYLYCFLIILALTVIISIVRQTKTRKEFFLIMAGVTAGLASVILILAGLSELLVILGIAESGFVL